MKKQLCSLLAAVCLLFAISIPFQCAQASSNTTVYLLAANDKFCDLPGGVLPVAVDGTIYIPYTVFDRDATGVDLGVYYLIRQDWSTILNLYSRSGMLTFTVNMGICEDNLGNAMNFRAVIRNGIPYVPAAAVCKFFDLQYSFLPTTDRGTLIRITNSQASLSDSMFLSSAKLGMSSRYNNIIQSMEPQPTALAATSTPAPTATATPAGGKKNVRVYLAVDASQAEEDLTLFLPSGTHILFLFTPDSLSAQGSLVRRAAAAGHSIGLIVSGTAEEALEQLKLGNEQLSHIARIRTHIVSAPSSLTAALTAEGWSCWQSNVSGSSTSTVLSSLESKQSVGRITLPATPAVLNRILAQIRSDGYTLRQPLETDL